jgi:23S rRNA pseudouridine2605 synthase
MSKLGILTRSRATAAILAGRVTVDGRVVLEPGAQVDLDRSKISLDGTGKTAAPWRTVLLHKPRGVVTTSRDPDERRTVYDVMGDEARGLVPVDPLDMATSGLLLLTSDSALAEWMTDPANKIARVYVVTVRGWAQRESRRVGEDS